MITTSDMVEEVLAVLNSVRIEKGNGDYRIGCLKGDMQSVTKDLEKEIDTKELLRLANYQHTTEKEIERLFEKREVLSKREKVLEQIIETLILN